MDLAIIKDKIHGYAKKIFYYIKGFTNYWTPKFVLDRKLQKILANLPKYDGDELWNRVNYYNKLVEPVSCEGMHELSEFTYLNRTKCTNGKKTHVYYFDTYEYTRYFPKNLKAAFCFGDITHVPTVPSLLKSRPISAEGNANSVVLKLEKLRHFAFLNDKVPFHKKKDLLIGRGATYQPHRVAFYEKYFGHPMCNLGATNRNELHPEWTVARTAIAEHLKYKFILCLEGNDVASNLKWVMSSNSLAVMPRPNFETWFMEGTLIPGFHYVEIKPDYSDLVEKLTYYIEHPNESQKIVDNAHQYVSQFKDRDKEDLISILVLQKYFRLIK